MTKHGPMTPVIIRITNGELICDPPGGKPDPGETREQAMEREFGEETGTTVIAGDLLDSLPHPVQEKAKEGLHRHFLKASHVKGKPSNRVPKEHKALMMTDVENAIVLFGNRIPESGKEYLRSEAKRLAEIPAHNIRHLRVG